MHRFVSACAICAALAPAAQATERGAKQLDRAIVGSAKKNERVRFVGSPYHGTGSAYTDRNPEIWKTSTQKRGETLRVFRLGNGGFKQVSTLVQLKNGTIVDGDITVKTEVKDGVMHATVQHPSYEDGRVGHSWGFEYDPRSGEVRRGGQRITEIDKGLSAAEAYHEYGKVVELREDD
jgi:hypothetical protein